MAGVPGLYSLHKKSISVVAPKLEFLPFPIKSMLANRTVASVWRGCIFEWELRLGFGPFWACYVAGGSLEFWGGQAPGASLGGRGSPNGGQIRPPNGSQQA